MKKSAHFGLFLSCRSQLPLCLCSLIPSVHVCAIVVFLPHSLQLATLLPAPASSMLTLGRFMDCKSLQYLAHKASPFPLCSNEDCKYLFGNGTHCTWQIKDVETRCQRASPAQIQVLSWRRRWCYNLPLKSPSPFCSDHFPLSDSLPSLGHTLLPLPLYRSFSLHV